MSPLLAEDRVVRSEREIATLAITRVSIVTIGIYALYEVLAAFTSANPIASWQFVFAAVTIVLYTGGYIHITRTDSPVSFAPLLGFFIIVPLLVDRSAQAPWISNGLTCILAAVYMTGTGSKQISYISGTTIAITQYIIAKAHLPSTSDLSDIQYFGSYFSSLWIVIVTVAMVRMRFEYLNMCDRMDQELDELRTRMFYRRQFLKRMNLRDFLNLQLHGTVLNSLIVFRNKAQDEGIEPGDLARVIGEELSSIRIETSIEESSLPQAIADQFSSGSVGELKITVGSFSDFAFTQTVKLQLVEIVREVLINAERHAGATSGTVELVHLGASRFELRISENSAAGLSHSDKEAGALMALESKTIARLTKTIAASYRTQLNHDESLLVHSITFDTEISDTDPISELTRLRFAAVDLFTWSFLQISIIYGLCILPGLFIKGAPTTERWLFAIAALSGAWAMYGRRWNAVARWIATLCALSILPLLEIATPNCARIPALAWMFNGMLAAVFLVSASTKNIVFRWAPGLIFLAESLLTTLRFPRSCNGILAGSTPGIIFILITAFLIGRIRNRNLAADAHLSRKAESDATNVETVESLLSFARQELVMELSAFAHTFSIPKSMKEKQVQALNIEIQKIRAFLLCSEFFEFEPARELYRWVVERTNGGSETRLNIVGEGKFEIKVGSWQEILATVEKSCAGQAISLTVLNTEKVRVGLEVSDSVLSQVRSELIGQGTIESVTGLR